MEIETAIRNLHFSFLIFGPSRKPVVEFFRDEVEESIRHATMLGEKITALGGLPAIRVRAVHEPQGHTLEAILKESIRHEEEAVATYTKLLELVKEDAPLRVLFENQVLEEQEHVEELRKYLREEWRE
jgi:bacterioferritin